MEFFFCWNTNYNLSKLHIRLDNLVMWNKKDPKIITKEKNLSFTELQKEWKIIHHMLQCWPGLIGLWELKVKRILGVYASNNSKLFFFVFFEILIIVNCLLSIPLGFQYQIPLYKIWKFIDLYFVCVFLKSI